MRGGCCRGLVAPGLHGRGSLGRRVGRCCKDRERPVWLPSPHRVRDRGGLGDVTAAAVGADGNIPHRGLQGNNNRDMIWPEHSNYNRYCRILLLQNIPKQS